MNVAFVLDGKMVVPQRHGAGWNHTCSAVELMRHHGVEVEERR